MSDVTGGAFAGDTVQGGLNDGIRLGVDGAHTMAVHDEMADLVAMGLPGGGAVAACGENAFFQHKHTSHKSAVSSASYRYGIGYF